MNFDEWLAKQPKKTEYLRFKLGVKLYRLGLWRMSHFMRDAQDQYLEDNMDKFLVDWAKARKEFKDKGEFYLSFGHYVNMQKGMFQAKNGIGRKIHFHKKNYIRGFLQRIGMKLGFRLRYLLRKYKI